MRPYNSVYFNVHDRRRQQELQRGRRLTGARLSGM